MPEKTLKEKVEGARKALKIIEITSNMHLIYTIHEDMCEALIDVEEALTALEERVAELELTVNLYREADSIHWPRPLTTSEIATVGIQPKEQEAPDDGGK